MRGLCSRTPGRGTRGPSSRLLAAPFRRGSRSTGPERSAPGRRWKMRLWLSLACVSPALASAAPAQRFGFAHQMLPAEPQSAQALALGDVEGDGDLGAFVGNGGRTGGGTARRYLNAGASVCTDVPATTLPAWLDVA